MLVVEDRSRPSSVASGSDRRIDRRVGWHHFVELIRQDSATRARALAVNLSRGGLFVADCVLGGRGDTLTCRVPNLSLASLTVPCTVAWVREEASADGEPAGMGVTFDRGQSDGPAIDEIVAKLAGFDGTTPIVHSTIDPYCESGTWGRDDLVTELRSRSLTPPRSLTADIQQMAQKITSARFSSKPALPRELALSKPNSWHRALESLDLPLGSSGTLPLKYFLIGVLGAGLVAAIILKLIL